MFGAKYDYGSRLNSQIQSICKFKVVTWHREIKGRVDAQIDELNSSFMCTTWKIIIWDAPSELLYNGYF